MKKLLSILAIPLLFMACEKQSSNSLSAGSGTNSNNNTTGTGGSLARFTIVGNYLYTVDGNSLSIFEINTGNAPVYKNKVNIGLDIEAIFPFKNKLFIASNSAMYIYNINNPIQPTQESFVQHLTGCDPIVANDSIAFLTVHGGNRCGSNINQLQVFNIKNINSPKLIINIPMTNPFGLGLKDNVLFVCDNGQGIRAYDVSNPYDIQPKYILTGEVFLDVIPMDSTMICMLPNGVAFYDISDLNMPVKLSTIKN